MIADTRQSHVQPPYLIRAATRTDLAEIVRLAELHAEYERSPLPKLSTENRKQREFAMEEMLFTAEPVMSCLVVQVSDALEGYATFGMQYSTWQARRYLYLDCLFLTSRIRRLGIGRLMMQHVRKEARAMGANEVQWQTPCFNREAIEFYKRLGASPKTKHRFHWRVNDDNDSE